MRAFVVLGFVFCFPIPSQEISLGNVSKITCFVSSGMQNLNSINQFNAVLRHCQTSNELLAQLTQSCYLQLILMLVYMNS